MKDYGISDARIYTAMKSYGGSFARALADALFCADDDNRSRIKAAFPDLLRKLADEMNEQEAVGALVDAFRQKWAALSNTTKRINRRP